MSNILPQLALFNEGAWEKFEANIVDELSDQPDGTVWEIYTGGLWNSNYAKTIGRGKGDEPAKRLSVLEGFLRQETLQFWYDNRVAPRECNTLGCNTGEYLATRAVH